MFFLYGKKKKEYNAPYHKRNRWQTLLVEDKKEALVDFSKMATDLVSYSFETWISALAGAAFVGCIGLLPIFVVPNEQTKSISSYLK